MTLRDLCSHVLVSRNIFDQLYEFLMKDFGDLSSVRQKDGHNSNYMLPQNSPRNIKKVVSPNFNR